MKNKDTKLKFKMSLKK